jgi:hypothetical protein
MVTKAKLVHDKIQNKNKSVYPPSGASLHMSSEHEGMVFCTPKLHDQGLFRMLKKAASGISTRGEFLCKLLIIHAVKTACLE